MPQSVHARFTESSFFSDPCLPTGQLWQESSWPNGAKWGFAMNVPGEQHPKRAVQVPRLLNTLEDPVRDSHAPPHSVRVTLLL